MVNARTMPRVKGNWNVVALTGYDSSGDNDGNVVERYSYTPYGEFVVLKGGASELGNVLPTSTVGNPFAHQGLAFDAEKGRYQNRQRERLLRRFAQRAALGNGAHQSVPCAPPAKAARPDSV